MTDRWFDSRRIDGDEIRDSADATVGAC